MDFQYDDLVELSFDEEEEFHLTDGFIHVKDINMEYYTPFLTSKKKFKYIGDDPNLPAIVDFLNSDDFGGENGYQWWSGDTRGCVLVRDNKVSDKPLVSLPPGIYDYESTSGNLPERLRVKVIERDDHIVPLGDQFEAVRADLESFSNREHVYRQVKTPYKMGVLLYGPPGNGKSILIQRLIEDYKNKAIVIYVHAGTSLTNVFLNKLGSHTKNMMKIFIFEELTTAIHNPGYTNWLLRFLDADISLDNVITIATTNYPEQLPQNLVNRPSRFDEIYEFTHPKDEERKLLLDHYMQEAVDPSIVAKTKGFSIAEVKQFCLFVKVHALSLEQAIEKINKRKDKCKKAFAASSERIGFGL